jgi:pimeloyl-ACP methyl ester carboxylesterase
MPQAPIPQAPIPQAPVSAANEFADLIDRHNGSTPVPLVQRRWVTVTNRSNVSGVFWGTRTPVVVLLHEAGSDARSWDRTLLALGRPAVALDLPGHGRSSQRAQADHRSRPFTASLLDAVRSFAPGSPLLVGRGLGALAAVAVATRAGQAAGRVVLVDTLPQTEDEATWSQLAALSAPLLVRTGDAPDPAPNTTPDAAALDRFRTQVPDGGTADVADSGPALAELLATLTD